MRLSKRALGVLAGFALVAPETSTFANVNLLVSKKGAAGTTSLSVPAGGSLDISVTLQTTNSEQITSVDYFLKSTLGASNASGIFTVSTQDLSTSVFTSFNGGSFSSSVLSPTSPDLGSGLNDPFNQPAVAGGPFEIADYHILVSPGAAVGSTYTLALADNGTGALGYGGPKPTFTPGSFDNVGAIAVTITAVPEPSIAMLSALGGVLSIRRRRGC